MIIFSLYQSTNNIKLKSLYILSIFLLFSCKKEEKPISVIQKPKETLFKKLSASETGIAFNNRITENLNNFFVVYNYAYNGGGVAIGDINNDNLPDIYFTGNQVENKLYLNKGNFKFEDITKTAGVAGIFGWNNGVVMVDINGDSLLDIYVCRGGWKGSNKERANLLFVNNGDNTFTEKAKDYGINDIGFSMMASFFDFDNDNDLDLYLINRPQQFNISHNGIAKGKKDQHPLFRHKLFENKNGIYKEVGLESGIDKTFSYGLGLVTSDINKDGFSDVYVANDYFESDYFFKNNGNKTFTQDIKNMTNHVAFYGMGVDVVDFNNDGFEDLIELEMTPSDHERAKVNMASMNVDGYNRILEQGNHYQYMHNMLQINNGNGFFSEVSQLAGIDRTDWSWSCLGSDFDNDGNRDLFISNGFRRDVFDKDASTKFVNYLESEEKKQKSKLENLKFIVNLFKENKIANRIYQNEGDLKFTSKEKEWGLQDISFSNGAAVADLDNDGDLDLVVNNINDPAFIYKNNAEKNNNNYLKIKLKGPKNNTLGLGAKITLYHKDSIQYYEMKNVRGYLSSVDPIAHFGLKNKLQIDSVNVIWPDGKKNTLKNVDVNTTLTIPYKNAFNFDYKKTNTSPVFIDITKKAFANKPLKHIENTFNDFKEQILLPHKLSTEGPTIAVADVNNDGLEDFYLGGSASYTAKLYIQQKNTTFKESKQNTFLNDKAYEDTASLFFDVNNDGFTDLYVVSGGNEFEKNSVLFQDRLYINNGKSSFTKSNNLPIINSSGGCVLPLDYDQDGDLDLFIGGRVVPNRYLEVPKSYILNNTNGIFTDVTKKVASGLEHLGMITDASWQDIDGDSINELIIVGEWMPITIAKLKDGVFNKTEISTLENTSGWWNHIESKDIDNDGDVDFIVGNLGENYKFKASEENPFFVYASDFDKNGTNDVFLAKKYKNRIVPVRGKECSTQQLPGLSTKIKTYKDFSKANIGTILGGNNTSSKRKEVQLFKSIILRNNKGKLVVEPLPYQSQFSTIQSTITDDFNDDGIVDIISAGNKFNVEIETTRADASVGLFLSGKRNNSFHAFTAKESGVFLSGNVKELKSILLGKEGIKGILVGVNNNDLRLLSQNN
ncbi:VCBS repeat-containing protein [Polaribacter sp. Hel1_85]|uniref:VCBS repeat-containing protein n=1 Tax=Polaribacter sp. Hel1_85 TaxID=1250005 RepID=UPI00052E2D82|nr:VCBS repeat-containing protein [Polaribacter sp. Hel1_85]KGL63128.1 ASPIC/UnbV-like protein [Polaribacter sp. Hel1_85]